MLVKDFTVISIQSQLFKVMIQVFLLTIKEHLNTSQDPYSFRRNKSVRINQMTNRPQWDSILENTSVLLSAFLNYFMRWTVEWVGSQQTNSNQKEWIYEYSLNKAAKVEPTCFIFTWCGSFLMWSCYPFKSDLVALMLVLLLQFPPAKCKVQFLTWLCGCLLLWWC